MLLLLSALANLRAQPVPHHFSGITASSDGTIVLGLDGSVSNMFSLTGTIASQFAQMYDLYPVDASTNLTDWTRLALLMRTNNNSTPLLFEDTNAASLNQRFYRTPTNYLITMFPNPSGPFTVGTIDRVMVDPSRTNLYRYFPNTNAFMVTFWYPSDSPAAGTLPGAMLDPRPAADASFYSYIGVDGRWAAINPRAVGHRFVGVPLSASFGTYPVVLYSHGLPVFRQSYSQQAEELASHGYIVIAVDHSDCWATEFPDGRYLLGNHNGDLPGRLKDMQFLVDELVQLQSSDPFFAGRLDLAHIGVFGHSFGGEVVETCRTNAQVKCAAIYDADYVHFYSGGLQKPLLVMLGQTNYNYSEDQWLFNKATNSAVLLQIAGADHPTCIDFAWWGEIPWGRSRALAIDACLVWFFDTYLKGESPPFPTNPEIYNVQTK